MSTEPTADPNPDKIKIVGGGLLGVVVKSNWQVCGQTPAPGQAVSSAPQLTVDRSTCGANSTTSPTPSTRPTAPTSTQPAVSPALTVENSPDLAALLAVPNSCSETIQTFAAQYQGRVIEFDGSVSAMSHHGTYETRYDILVAPGDEGPSSTIGPSFQFRDVNPSSDLNTPGSLGVGDKLHVVGRVGDYSSEQCLFLLTPVH